MILIAAALEEELDAGMALCRNHKRIDSGSVKLWQAVRGDRTYHFLKTGVGPRRSTANLEEALKVIQPFQILVVGYAGALDPGLKLGSLVAVGRALAFSLDRQHPDWEHIQLDGEFELANCAELARSAESAGLTAFTGSSLTSSYVLGDPEHKRLLFERFHASVVDMETASLAFAAAAGGIALSCVRVVSDEALDTFLAPFSYNPSTNIPARAVKLLDTGVLQTYREWKSHASVAKESLSRFLAHYL
jgi:nucleoside phosphorylase